MSKFLKVFGPAVTGTALVLFAAYFLADQFVTDVPAPLRGKAVAAANAQDAPATATDGETTVDPQMTGATVQGDPMPETIDLALGRAATAEEIGAWDIDIRPDGQGLPQGRGDAITGEEVYTEACASCHGDFGEAVGRWPVLAGGFNSLSSRNPVKTIGSYWPYLSTVYDYVHRAMPFGNAQSLTDDEVYAITAYLLYLNDLVEEDFELSHENFAEIELPNESNFFPDNRPETELAVFSGDVCMENCKESVKITGRARVVDVTPDDAAARERREAAAAALTTDSGVTETDASEEITEDAAEQPVEVAQSDTDVEVTSEPPVEVTDTGGGEPDPELVAAGAKAFKKCASCHQVGEDARNRSGPHLNGVYGRLAGSVDGFKYSSAFQEANAEGLTWNEATLSEFLAKPRAYIKGTKMSFAGFKDEADTAAVLAYLRTFEE